MTPMWTSLLSTDKSRKPCLDCRARLYWGLTCFGSLQVTDLYARGLIGSGQVINLKRSVSRLMRPTKFRNQAARTEQSAPLARGNIPKASKAATIEG